MNRRGVCMITISLCMIVKDEEKTLEKCLKSIKDIPDEIIIVDTGSNDRTKEIALNWTPNVHDFKWNDDFSAARNFSFDKASMDYILWLDADDILLDDDYKKFIELKHSLDSTIEAVSMIYHTLLDDNNNVLSSVKRLRLVKREKQFQWFGYVHEDLKTENQFNYIYSNIVITHVKPNEKTESKRNLMIYEKHIRQGKKMTPHDVFHYARELHKHKLYEKAIKIYLRFLTFKDIAVEHKLYVYNKLASCYYFVGKREKERETILKSFELDIPRPEFCCRLAEVFLEKNQYAQAAFWYKMALEVPTPEHPLTIENRPFMTWLPHKQLGLCYYQLGDYNKSYFHNQKAFDYLPNDQGIISNLQLLEELIKN